MKNVISVKDASPVLFGHVILIQKIIERYHYDEKKSQEISFQRLRPIIYREGGNYAIDLGYRAVYPLSDKGIVKANELAVIKGICLDPIIELFDITSCNDLYEMLQEDLVLLDMIKYNKDVDKADLERLRYMLEQKRSFKPTMKEQLLTKRLIRKRK